jgi:hypothetical protein
LVASASGAKLLTRSGIALANLTNQFMRALAIQNFGVLSEIVAQYIAG